MKLKLKRVIGWTAGALAIGLLVTGMIAYWRSSNSCDDPAPPALTAPVRAVVYCDFGSPEVLKVEAIEKPVPGDTQLLIRVRSASLNPLDWHYMRGTPYIARFDFGLRKPKNTRLGVDYSGVVEAVGKNVTQFKPGDEVFGGRTGALAEYITVREAGAVVVKPAGLGFDEAATVPVAAITALQGLRDKGQLQAGQKVLINGASGGVGTFAVQIAKSMGADVTGVSSTRNVELVISIGADRVIDYTKADFTKDTVRYDLILDNVGNHSLSDLRRVMKPEGRYVMVGGPSGRWIAPLPRAFRAMVMSWFVSQDMKMFISELNKGDLTILRDLMEAGKVKPVIDRQYKLSEVRDAIGYLETGRARGKVVVTMN
jgi:NADPH:quinone reductase-like Zn-dependent oxidoreductase